MNNELILKSTGKEFSIINELIKSIKYSGCVFISKSNPLIYQSGDDSIIMSTDNEYEVILDSKIGDSIKITDIYEPKDEIELDISVGIVRLYKVYEFIVRFPSGRLYKIKGKFKIKETKPISSKTMKELGFDRIREIYEKIESINLIDHTLFENDKFIFKDYKFTISNDPIKVTYLNNIKSIVKKFSDTIDYLYKNGISKVSPMDTDCK